MISETPQSDDDLIRTLSAIERAEVGSLIDNFELARDGGQDLSPEYVCRDKPELLKVFLATLRKLHSVDEKLERATNVGDPVRIGEFTVLERLADGGSGVVFRCRQQKPLRDVAIKVMKPSLETKLQERRFEREMAAVGAFDHDGVAHVYGSGVTDWCGVRSFWFAMELLEAGPIDDYVRQHQLSDHQILNLFDGVCQTVFAAHQAGVLHRDLKPSNILMSADAKPHVVDFGIAELPVSASHDLITEPFQNQQFGTVAWMAPELLSADNALPSVRCDIYSLGVVLFQLLSGQHPLGIESASVAQVTLQIHKGKTHRLSAVRGNVSRDLDTFVSQLTALNPLDRYQTMGEVLSDLHLLQAGDPIHARPVSFAERSWRWCVKNKLISLALTSTLVFAATAAMLFILSTEKTRQYARQLQEKTKTLEHSLMLRDASATSSRMRAIQQTVTVSPSLALQQLIDDENFPADRRNLTWHLLHHLASVEHKELPAVSGEIRQICFDQSGNHLVSVHRPRTLTITDIQSGEQTTLNEQFRLVSPVLRFNDADAIFAQSLSGDIVRISISQRAVVQRIHLGTDVRQSYAVSPNGSWVIGFTADNRIVRYDGRTSKRHYSEQPLSDVAVGVWFCAEGQQFETVAANGQWQGWNTETGELIREVDLSSIVPNFMPISIAVSGGQIAKKSWINLGHSNGVVHFINFEENRKPFIHRQQAFVELRDLDVLPDREFIITCDGTVSLYNPLDGSRNRIFRMLGAAATASAVSRNGDTVAVGDKAGIVTLLPHQQQSLQKAVLRPFDNWDDRLPHPLGIPVRRSDNG